MLRFRTLSASRALLAAIATVGLVGCTQPVDVDADTVLTSKGKSLAFSYDTVIDQISHMSCTNMPMTSSAYNKSAFYSYRVGAYSNGGLMLKDSFFETLKNKKAEYMSEVLAASPHNSNTILQVALRSRANYQSIYAASSSPVLDQDYANMLSELGAPGVSDSLIALPVNGRLRFLRNGSVGGTRLEGSLYFTSNATLTQATRDFIQGRGGTSSNTGMLAVTYTNGSDTSARSIVDFSDNDTDTTTNLKSVYGRGYIMTFAKPAVSGVTLPSNYPENVISLVQEQSLDSTTPITAGNWSCPTTMQFRIVRAEDINKSGARCRKMPDPALISPELRLVRNSLRTEDWYVDMDNRCIVPKKAGTDGRNGCYGTITDIKYNLGDACTTDSNGFSNCTQYASICYRTN